MKYLVYLVICLLVLLDSSFFEENILYPYLKSNTFKIFDETGEATSFIYNFKNKQYLVTNAHVCKEKKTMFIKEENKIHLVNILYSNILKDICLLKPIENKIGIYGDKYKNNKTYITYGFPLHRLGQIEKGIFNDLESMTLPTHLVSTNETAQKCINQKSAIKFNGLVYICLHEYKNISMSKLLNHAGQSGSPIINKTGRLVGIIFSKTNVASETVMLKVQTLNEAIKEYEASNEK